MTGKISYLSLYLILLLRFYFFDNSLCYCGDIGIITTGKDSIYLKEYLYNGKVWRDIYSHKVVGDEYLFSKDFLPGTVTFNSLSFQDLKLRYDIFNDELLILTYNGNVLELNKEMVDKFQIDYQHIVHSFKNMEPDSTEVLTGYAEVLYDGKISLYIKHVKVISRLAHGKPYDDFEESSKVYLSKDGKTHKLNSKKELISLLDDKHQQIMTFIRSNKIKISKKAPESFVPILIFYDSISP